MATFVLKLAKNEFKKINKDLNKINRMARRADLDARKKTINKVYTQTVRTVAQLSGVRQKDIRRIIKKFVTRTRKPAIWIGSKGFPATKGAPDGSELKYGPLLEEPGHATPFKGKLRSGKGGLFFRKGKSRLPIDQAHFTYFEKSKKVVERFLNTIAVGIYKTEFQRRLKFLLNKKKPR